VKIKFYPKHSPGMDGNAGFSADEIKRSVHWLYADIECPHCGKLQAVANTSYLGGPCIRCGKPTSGEVIK
jgi:DNA-directed RNA polymerase subunit RPC12/RpoP